MSESARFCIYAALLCFAVLPFAGTVLVLGVKSNKWWIALPSIALSLFIGMVGWMLILSLTT